MPDKTPKLEPLKPGEFQLDPKDFHTKDFLVNKAIDSVVGLVNSLDLNKDGKRDIVQLAPILLKCAPSVIGLIEVIDWNKLKCWVINTYVAPEKRAEFRDLTDKLAVNVAEARAVCAPKSETA